MNARDKEVSETWRLRFLRRAAGRIGKADARRLGRLWVDLYWRCGGDNLALRDFRGTFKDAKRFNALRALAELGVNRFWHYGPNPCYSSNVFAEVKRPGLARASERPAPAAEVAA